MKNAKLAPIILIVLLGAVVSGVGALWYWNSQPITMTLHIPEGVDIVAKCSVNPLTAWNSMSKVAFGDLVEVNTFLDGDEVDLTPGVKYIFVRLGDTNANQFFTRVNATYLEGMLVTCSVSIVDRRDIGEYPTVAHWHSLGPIAVDGSESMQLIANGDPLYVLGEPTEHMRYILYAFTVQPGNLPPGDHVLSVEVHLGDTA